MSNLQGSGSSSAINHNKMSKDKGSKNKKKAASTSTGLKSGSDYKNEGKVTAPIVIVPKELKPLAKKK
jgi:hypothetical protein